MITEEIWSVINEYYAVSNIGRVKRLKSIVNGKLNSKRQISERILTPGLSGNGYFTVSITSNYKRKSLFVHRLIAEAFIPNPEGKPEVNHKNGVKTDNRIENLEWVTRSQNRKHAYDIGLSKKGKEHHWSKTKTK